MGTTWESTKTGFGAGLGATTGYRIIDYFAGPTQDERSRSRDRQAELAYQRERDAQAQAAKERQLERELAANRDEQERQRNFAQKQSDEERRNQRRIQQAINETNLQISEIDAETRRYEADQAKIAAEESNRMRQQLAEADFQLRERHHQEKLSLDDEIARRQINAQLNVARQSCELEKYLASQRINSDKEIARFRTLAARETQILVARENAANILQDRMVQDAMKTFPLNISPIVLLRNRPHSLKQLLAFSGSTESPVGIENVYEEVTRYASSPEALNIFIAPVHVDSGVQNREQLSEQLWDSVYSNLEGLFNEHYNRNGRSPVILYPNAWQKEAMSGTHACETMYYFLKDMPCLVLEPRFDGYRFSIIVSAWGLGYETDQHVRSNIDFDFNIDEILARAAYTRSKRSLVLLDKLDDSLDARLIEIRRQLRQNVMYYESLSMDDSESANIRNLQALGVYRLFNIEPMQDLSDVVDSITQLMGMVLAILADIHHLLSTDADVVFPGIFQKKFPGLFEDSDLRERVFRWYEAVYIRLRNQDNRYLSESQQRHMTKIREAQIRNLAFTLGLIDERTLSSEVDDAIRDYAKERYGFTSDDLDEIWWKCIDEMGVDDIEFFDELKDRLPRADKRRRRIINRIADLK